MGILLILLIALFTWLLALFMPWWSLAIPCFILGGLMGRTGLKSFIYGFLGVGLLWLMQSLVAHIGNDGILTQRIADLFSLPHPYLVLVITVCIGGIAGGFSTLTGYLCKQTFFNSENRTNT